MEKKHLLVPLHPQGKLHSNACKEQNPQNPKEKTKRLQLS